MGGNASRNLNISMSIFYHKLDFDLSSTAKQWVIDRYAERFKEHFWHDADMTQVFDDQAQQEWITGPVGKEIIPFLESYGCDVGFQGITAFISNTEDYYPGNPHVDIKVDKDLQQDIIKSRMNIMILGNPQDEMVWWDWLSYGDERLQEAEYTTYVFDQAQSFKCVNVPGDTKSKRLAYLGEPTHRERNLLTPSAFVRTDCAHTANLSPGPRLLVTVSFNKTLDEILLFNRL
jgi:hypothetical protein